MRRVSVVLVANGRYDLLRTLRAIVSQPFLREVVIVDRGLSPFLRQSLDSFIKEHVQCHIISARENSGIAEAYNLGSHYTSSDYLLLMKENVLLPKHALARLYGFIKKQTSPCAIGLSEAKKSNKTPQKLGKLTGFYLFDDAKPGSFSHTSVVSHEAIFMPTRLFAMLKGMDVDCFDEIVGWDFCLRAHYAGGSVYKANDIIMTLQSPARSSRWSSHVKNEWRRYHSWRYFYDKYVSNQTNLLKLLKTQAFLFFQFLRNIASLW